MNHNKPKVLSNTRKAYETTVVEMISETRRKKDRIEREKDSKYGHIKGSLIYKF